MGVIVVVLMGLVAAWLSFIALLWLLRPRDARLADLVRVVPDIVRLCRDVLTDREATFAAHVAISVLLVWLLITPRPVSGPARSANRSIGYYPSPSVMRYRPPLSPA